MWSGAENSEKERNASLPYKGPNDCNIVCENIINSLDEQLQELEEELIEIRLVGIRCGQGRKIQKKRGMLHYLTKGHFPYHSTTKNNL